MQDPDRLNPTSLPIDGGRPPIGGIPLNFDNVNSVFADERPGLKD